MRHGTGIKDNGRVQSAFGIVYQALIAPVLLVKPSLTIHHDIGLNAFVDGLLKAGNGIGLFLD